MKVRFQRFASLLLALVLCVGLCAVPASAAVGDAGDFIKTSIWNMTLGFWPGLISAFLSDGVTPETATDQDWQSAYNQYVNSLQDTYHSKVFDSDGAFFITVPLVPFESNKNFTVLSSELRYPQTVSFQCIASRDCSFLVYIATDSFVAPVDGFYSFDCTAPTFYLNGELVPPGIRNDYSFSTKYFSSGAKFLTSSSSNSFGCDPSDVGSLIIPWRVKCVPAASVSLPSVDSRPGSLTGITYGYQNDTGEIIVYTAKDSGMFNEEGGYLYNPVTGETLQADSWYYDYENRRYDIALKNNQGTATLEYGDQGATLTTVDSHNVTTIYNYYYMVPGGGGTVEPTPSPSPSPDPSPSPSPAPHEHNYKSTVTTESSCLSAGVKTFKCSVCGDTYTEKIPATGHTWVVDRTVNTTYDPNGNIVQQGYTIYKCTVCGNEYKDETGTSPPASGDDGENQGFLGWLGEKLGGLLGSIGEGIIGLLKAALGKVLDGLQAIVDMVSGKLNTVLDSLFRVFDEIPKMFSGFTDFLGAMFSFLPPEIVTILIFGILAVVLVAVLKMFLK